MSSDASKSYTGASDFPGDRLEIPKPAGMPRKTTIGSAARIKTETSEDSSTSLFDFLMEDSIETDLSPDLTKEKLNSTAIVIVSAAVTVVVLVFIIVIVGLLYEKRKQRKKMLLKEQLDKENEKRKSRMKRRKTPDFQEKNKKKHNRRHK
ncbi:hypothetical protein Y032_0074g878 [Ancylostoma ceylanicum]|uniref:Uncharacterized protein n=1 Tax=Ancylostoma ceylanicum TaxID=53326 RepID=A0A016TVT3_9BILA|nr:hypothetical protein Y032_0074g878 [Ancylostoma ceylanicum]